MPFCLLSFLTLQNAPPARFRHAGWLSLSVTLASKWLQLIVMTLICNDTDRETILNLSLRIQY